MSLLGYLPITGQKISVYPIKFFLKVHSGFHFIWHSYWWMPMCLPAQLCPTPCDPMDCSLPGSSVYGIFQARILEWVAISCSRASSWPREQTQCLLHWQLDFLPLSHLCKYFSCLFTKGNSLSNINDQQISLITFILLDRASLVALVVKTCLSMQEI